MKGGDGRKKGETWKPHRVMTDEQIAEIMTRVHGIPMGRTAVLDTGNRAERKLRRSPILRELFRELLT